MQRCRRPIDVVYLSETHIVCCECPSDVAHETCNSAVKSLYVATVVVKNMVHSSAALLQAGIPDGNFELTSKMHLHTDWLELKLLERELVQKLAQVTSTRLCCLSQESEQCQQTLSPVLDGLTIMLQAHACNRYCATEHSVVSRHICVFV